MELEKFKPLSIYLDSLLVLREMDLLLMLLLTQLKQLKTVNLQTQMLYLFLLRMKSNVLLLLRESTI